jgi:AcrR family transcriptional regulator
VAWRLFGRSGLHGTTTREIAQESKLNVSLISYYFGSKQGLYRTIISSHFENIKSSALPLLECISKEKFKKADFLSLLNSLVDLQIDQNLKYPDIKQIFFHEIVSGMQNAEDLFKSNVDPFLEAFTKIFKKAQREGFVKKSAHPRLCLIMLINVVDFYVLSYRHHAPLVEGCYEIPAESKKLRADIVKMITEGVFE